MIAERGTCSREELRHLAGANNAPCVSIYMPTHRYGNEIAGDRIRFKNLITEAERRGDRHGGGARVRELLAPLRALEGQPDFWLHQTDGLAALASPSEGVVVRHLPAPVEELATVSDHFCIRPLLAATSDEDVRFMVLALSQKTARLFDCDSSGVREIDISGGPTSLTDAVGSDWEQRALQFHTRTAATGPGQRRPAMFHGQGRSAGDSKDELGQFVTRLDHHIHPVLVGRGWPLMLAGVENVTAAYRNASAYANIMEEQIEGNPDLLDARQIHELATAVVGPRIEEAHRRRLERIRQAVNAGLVSTSVREILEAVEHARVGTLVVRRSEPLWGFAGHGGVGVELHPTRREESEDLLDVAARRALCTGAEVLTAEPEEMPEGAPLVASLRF